MSAAMSLAARAGAAGRPTARAGTWLARAWRTAGAWLAAGVVAASAQAGQACRDEMPRAESVGRAMSLALSTARALDESGAQVVALARAGQDLARYGLRWSHLGLAYREAPPGPEGVPGTWRVVHKLNRCGTAQGAVYRQGLGEFFLDDMQDYRAGIVVLARAVQAALRPVLADDGRVALMHTADYSMVAYPWAQRYQQSNQWAIETLAMTQAPATVASRARAQAWLRLQGYEPTTLRLDAMTRLGARATQANVAFDDHPGERRMAGRIDTVTVDSVFDWLSRSGLGGEARTVY